jgi:hypothetical protein
MMNLMIHAGVGSVNWAFGRARHSEQGDALSSAPPPLPPPHSEQGDVVTNSHNEQGDSGDVPPAAPPHNEQGDASSAPPHSEQGRVGAAAAVRGCGARRGRSWVA